MATSYTWERLGAAVKDLATLDESLRKRLEWIKGQHIVILQAEDFHDDLQSPFLSIKERLEKIDILDDEDLRQLAKDVVELTWEIWTRYPTGTDEPEHLKKLKKAGYIP